MPLSEPTKEPEIFFDNRTESIRQRKMIELINKSDRVAQLQSYQEIADKGLKNNLTSPAATVQAMFRAKDTRTPEQRNQDDIISFFQQSQQGSVPVGPPFSLPTPSNSWDHTGYFQFTVTTANQNTGTITAHVHYKGGRASAGHSFLQGDARGGFPTPTWLVQQNQNMPPLGNQSNAPSATTSGNTTSAASSASATNASAAASLDQVRQ